MVVVVGRGLDGEIHPIGALDQQADFVVCYCRGWIIHAQYGRKGTFAMFQGKRIVLLSAACVVLALIAVACTITISPAQTEGPVVTVIVTATPVTQVVPLPGASPFEVVANQVWQDTGVSVKPGDTLTIVYVSGKWAPWPGGAYDASGTGVISYCDCNVLQYVSHASLIGKIGDSDPFPVGSYYSHAVTQSGPLSLQINDAVLRDNSGSITVKVSVTH